MKGFGKKFLALGIGATLTLGNSPVAFANQTLSSDNNYTYNTQAIEAEIQLEQALELIFTKFVIQNTEGSYVVDEAAVTSAGYVDNLQVFRSLVAEMNASGVQASLYHFSSNCW